MSVEAIYKCTGGNKIYGLGDPVAYSSWVDAKIDKYPNNINDITVTVDSLDGITDKAYHSIFEICEKSNLAVIKFKHELTGKDELASFGETLGLNRLDDNLCADKEAISSVRVQDGSKKHEGYIPYTEKALNWHTDGYYNLENRQINAILMYCDGIAESGGENRFLDQEILYWQLRKLNPDYIRVLQLPDVMTIPANVVDGQEIRAEQTGPVFSINADTNRLHMRYSARKRNIVWKDAPLVQEAAEAIESLLNGPNDYVFNYTPVKGQLVVSNNCIHSRAAFKDSKASGQQRIIYRARYFDRIRKI